MFEILLFIFGICMALAVSAGTFAAIVMWAAKKWFY